LPWCTHMRALLATPLLFESSIATMRACAAGSAGPSAYSNPTKLDVGPVEKLDCPCETQSFHLVLRFADAQRSPERPGRSQAAHSRRHVEHERRQRLSQLEIPRQGLDDERLHRVGLLAAEHRRSAADCFDHLGVASRWSRIPDSAVADLLHRWDRVHARGGPWSPAPWPRPSIRTGAPPSRRTPPGSGPSLLSPRSATRP